MKTCSTCHQSLPATAEHFAPRGTSLRGQCRHCRSTADKQWREQHADRLAAYYRDYHEAHRSVRLEQMAANYRDDPESYRERERRWRAEHPDREAARRQRRRALLAAAAGEHTAAEWEALLDTYGRRCLACGTADRLTADHVIPLSLGGSDSITNIQPLCVSCNSTKDQSTADYR